MSGHFYIMQLTCTLNVIFMFATLFFSSESGFVCLEIERKSDNILTLRMGRLSRNQDEACNTHLFFDANIPTTTIISENLRFISIIAQLVLNFEQI